MFGGYGVYYEDLMFALVVDELLYLKADEASAAELRARGSAPFEYQRRGKRVSLSFYAAPSELFEDPSLATRWGQRALEAAVRSKAGRSGKARPGTSPRRRTNP